MIKLQRSFIVSGLISHCNRSQDTFQMKMELGLEKWTETVPDQFPAFCSQESFPELKEKDILLSSNKKKLTNVYYPKT